MQVFIPNTRIILVVMIMILIPPITHYMKTTIIIPQQIILSPSDVTTWWHYDCYWSCRRIYIFIFSSFKLFDCVMRIVRNNCLYSIIVIWLTMKSKSFFDKCYYPYSNHIVLTFFCKLFKIKSSMSNSLNS